MLNTMLVLLVLMIVLFQFGLATTEPEPEPQQPFINCGKTFGAAVSAFFWSGYSAAAVPVYSAGFLLAGLLLEMAILVWC
ncbi:MAG: hypothetical protein HY645_11375 [Acidobacteria bacterium]|nr:hypothetical protein [Acidobacteriota bacterium]